jgi:hypothetical protein
MSEQSFSSVHCFHSLNVGCECVRLVFGKTVKNVFTDMVDIITSWA